MCVKNMRISILTLFPEMLRGPFDQSIVRRAIDKHLIAIEYVNIRDFADDAYKSVDGRPYGGGVGMILRVDVVDRALSSVLSSSRKRGTAFARDNKTRVILLDAGGKIYTQAKARELSKLNHLILICGHYEGVDARVQNLADEVISIGRFVVTGGEIPAMIIADSVARLVPGVLAKPEATAIESFTNEGETEYPQYTEPREYNGMKVPDVLLSGNHKAINQWRASRTKRV